MDQQEEEQKTTEIPAITLSQATHPIRIFTWPENHLPTYTHAHVHTGQPSRKNHNLLVKKAKPNHNREALLTKFQNQPVRFFRPFFKIPKICLPPSRYTVKPNHPHTAFLLIPTGGVLFELKSKRVRYWLSTKKHAILPVRQSFSSEIWQRGNFDGTCGGNRGICWAALKSNSNTNFSTALIDVWSMESKVDWLRVDSHLLFKCQTFCLTIPPFHNSPCHRRRCHWAFSRRVPSSAWHCHHLQDKKQSVSVFMTTMKSQARKGGANISANKRNSHPSVNSHFRQSKSDYYYAHPPRHHTVGLAS